jgi:hypothetical protein
MQEYKRIVTMKKVEENNKRTEEMLRTREELANTRRKNAVEAKIRKDKIMQTLEKSKTGGGTALKKILAQLSNDDGDIPASTGSKRKKKKRRPSVASKKTSDSSRRQPSKGSEVPKHSKMKNPKTWNGGANSQPPSIIEICGPPPEAPSLLARLAEASEKEDSPKRYVSPYATSPFASSS